MAKKRKRRMPDPAQFAAGVMNELISRVDPGGPLVQPPADTSGKNPAAVALGRLGGLKGGPARAKKLGKRKLSEIGKKGAAKRWGRT